MNENTNINYNKLLSLASQGDISQLDSVSQLSDRSFYQVLKIVRMKRYAYLFEQVFTPNKVLVLEVEKWFSVLCTTIYLGSKERFIRYFSKTKFLDLKQIYKNTVARRFAVEYEESSLLIDLFSLGAKVDGAMLDEIEPSHPSFSLVLSYAEQTVVTYWVEEHLRKALSSCKHAANYTPVAKSHLQKGYGCWESSEFDSLEQFKEWVRPYESVLKHKRDVDWLVLSILTNDLSQFNQLIQETKGFDSLASNGMLPLVEACGRSGRSWAAKKLLELGADINHRDGNNHSALFAALAKRQQDSELISLLLSNGANPNHRDFTHSTILHTLKEHLDDGLITLLDQHGAQAYGPYEPMVEFSNYSCKTLVLNISS